MKERMIVYKPAFNYITLIFLLLLNSCASKTYEWVKINPHKIAKAKTAKPYSESVNYVNVLVNAKYKAEHIIYVENSTDYFTSQASKVEKPKNLVAKRNIKNRKVLLANKIAKKATTPNVNNKPIAKPELVAKPKPVVNSKSLETKVVEDEAAMRRLNNALILPKKKKPAKIPTESVIPEKAIVEQEMKNDIPASSNKQGNLSYDNGLNQLEDQDFELKNSEIEDASAKPLSDNEIKEEGVKRNSYLWIGLVLLIMGLIIGLIFGGLAYFISVVGIVFLLIGYLIRT